MGRTITYSQLDREVVSRGWGKHAMFVVYGNAAGAIGDALIETGKNWGQHLPPLNALVLNKNTGIPGSGVDYYLKHYLGYQKATLSSKDRKDMTEAIHEKIFNFQKWDQLLREYGVEPVPIGLAKELGERKISKPRHGGWSSEGESEEHKRLKHYVAENPSVVGLVGYPNGDCEYDLASGDRTDVLFKNKAKVVAIEVKSSMSNEADLIRGVFQCVKYRAVIKAEQKANREIPNGQSILIIEQPLGESLENLAELLDVQVVCVKRPRR